MYLHTKFQCRSEKRLAPIDDRNVKSGYQILQDSTVIKDDMVIKSLGLSLDARSRSITLIGWNDVFLVFCEKATIQSLLGSVVTD
jgi:hypothetical protein